MLKKMCSKFCYGKASDMVGYTPPTLHKGVCWFVDFMAMDPVRDQMHRKRYYIPDNLSENKKKQRACGIIKVLTKQLTEGWNPWVKADESRGFVLFNNCIDRYLEYVDRMDRTFPFYSKNSPEHRNNLLVTKILRNLAAKI